MTRVKVRGHLTRSPGPCGSAAAADDDEDDDDGRNSPKGYTQEEQDSR